jgi:TrmH family RNA methyltransferase
MTVGAAHGGAKSLRGGDQGLAPSAERVHRRTTAMVKAFAHARANEDLVVLEGFHPLKHALRFGAAVETIVTFDRGQLMGLVADHAPELAAAVETRVEEIPRAQFRRLGPYEPHTGVVAIAARAPVDPQALLDAPGGGPVVLLEDPRHRGNVGAVIRVAAAAQAAGVLNTGPQDPWHPVVVRGAAGLQFAVPVARVAALPVVAGSQSDRVGSGGSEVLATDRALIALDPLGDAFEPARVPARAILAYGSERAGVSAELRDRADMCLRLPMRAGVSSLNLATAVAAVLYSLRLCATSGPDR